MGKYCMILKHQYSVISHGIETNAMQKYCMVLKHHHTIILLCDNMHGIEGLLCENIEWYLRITMRNYRMVLKRHNVKILHGIKTSQCENIVWY